MRKLFNLSLVMMAILTLSVTAQEVVKVGNIDSPMKTTVIQSTEDRIVVQFEIGSFTKQAMEINGSTYYLISLGRERHDPIKGDPFLPRIARGLLISDTGAMDINVLSSEYTDFVNTPVVPSKGTIYRNENPAEVPYEFGPVYNLGEWYPAQLASLREPHILRDFRGTVVEVNAFQYNSNQNTLRVYTSVVVEITKTRDAGVNEIIRSRGPAALQTDFAQIYKDRFINYEHSASRYTPMTESGSMLIICDDKWLSNVQPLVSHKNGRGIATTLVGVSTIGNNATAIKNHIQTAYNAGGLAFVLLVGDSDTIATPSASGGSSDPSYAKLAGNDQYPDIIVGRFSAQSAADVDTQVNKTINYEKYSAEGWHLNAIGIGSEQGAGQGDDGEADWVHQDNIWKDLSAGGYTGITKVYATTGGTAKMITDAVNAGVGIINYTGHGSTTSWGTTGFSNTNIGNLGNGDKLPFIMSVACVNGQFAGYTCFGEAWLRKVDGGAVGAYMSSINQSWAPPMEAQDESNLLLKNNTYKTFGALMYSGSCAMMQKYGDASTGGGTKMYDTWHIFGDPSLKMRSPHFND